MRLLIWLTLICGVFLSACCAIALFVGRQQALPPHVDLLHLTDCQLPCWLGIHPGETTLEEAEARLLDVYGSESNHAVMRVPDEILSYEILLRGASKTRINVTFVGSPIEMITVAPISNPLLGSLTLGDIFAVYGKPSGVIIDDLFYILHGDKSAHLMIPIALGISRPGNRVLIDQTVSMLVFYQTSERQKYLRQSPWQGFTELQPHYLPVTSQ